MTIFDSAGSGVCAARWASFFGTGFLCEEARKMSAPDTTRALIAIIPSGASAGDARCSAWRDAHPRPATGDDEVLKMMRPIDQLFKAWFFLGSRRMTNDRLVWLLDRQIAPEPQRFAVSDRAPARK